MQELGPTARHAPPGPAPPAEATGASSLDGARPLTPADFSELMATLPVASQGGRLAVAVSGGADSMALALLLAEWAAERRVALTALVVDHGLRPEAAAEAAATAAQLAGRGIAAEVLTWHGEKPASGIQAAARTARYALLSAWCRGQGHCPLVLAHHRDDQVETVLLRIAGNTGPDGLAGMRPFGRLRGTMLLRPLLAVAKDRLVATCIARGATWVEDPGNRDRRFHRVRLRQDAAAIARAGLDGGRILRLAAAMAATGSALEREAVAFMAAHGRVDPAGFVTFGADAFARLPRPFANWLLRALLRAVGGDGYAARPARVARLCSEIAEAPSGAIRRRTLGRCLIEAAPGGQIRLVREADDSAPPVTLRPGRWVRWDGRFEALSSEGPPLRIEALGTAGWRRLRLCQANQGELAALQGLPPAVPPTFPVLRNPAGGYLWAHLVAGHGDRPGGGRRTWNMAFAPDTDWVARLAQRTARAPAQGIRSVL